MQSLVLTVIQDDRAGLIEKLSRAISDKGGNWMESSMAQFIDQFAGILRVDVPDANADAPITALESLDRLLHQTRSKPGRIGRLLHNAD